MPVRVKCTSCGKSLDAVAWLAQQNVGCPDCGGVVEVPNSRPLVGQETSDSRPENADALSDSSPVTDSARSVGRRPCPACGELIMPAAAKCRFCGEIFDPALKLKGGAITTDEIRRFRREVHGVGGFWIFSGVVWLMLGVWAAFAESTATTPGKDVELLIGAIFFCVGGMTWLTLGIFACLEHRWAMWVGLVLCYVVLLGLLLAAVTKGRGVAIPIVVVILVIVQTHRALALARKMLDSGMALTTNPAQLSK